MISCFNSDIATACWCRHDLGFGIDHQQDRNFVCYALAAWSWGYRVRCRTCSWIDVYRALLHFFIAFGTKSQMMDYYAELVSQELIGSRAMDANRLLKSKLLLAVHQYYANIISYFKIVGVTPNDQTCKYGSSVICPNVFELMPYFVKATLYASFLNKLKRWW